MALKERKYNYPIIRSNTYDPFDKEELTVDDTVGGVSFDTDKIRPAGEIPAEIACCTLETAQIRHWIDGSAPTTTEGHLTEIGDTLVVEGEVALENFRAIRTGGTSGELKVSYGR
jgi:hypothetical protein